MELLLEPLGSPIILRAILASAMVGVVCAVVGTYSTPTSLTPTAAR